MLFWTERFDVVPSSCWNQLPGVSPTCSFLLFLDITVAWKCCLHCLLLFVVYYHNVWLASTVLSSWIWKWDHRIFVLLFSMIFCGFAFGKSSPMQILPLCVGLSLRCLFFFTVCTWVPIWCSIPLLLLILCLLPFPMLLWSVPQCCPLGQPFLATGRIYSAICWWYIPCRALSCHGTFSGWVTIPVCCCLRQNNGLDTHQTLSTLSPVGVQSLGTPTREKVSASYLVR